MARIDRGGLALPALLVVALLAGCRHTGDTPAIREVRPAVVVAGGFFTVAGSGFAPGADVRLDGRPAAPVTWVNRAMLTAIAPADLMAGPHQLMVRTLDGRSATMLLDVAVPAQPQPRPPASLAPAPLPSPSPEPAATPGPAPSPLPAVAAPPPSAGAPGPGALAPALPPASPAVVPPGRGTDAKDNHKDRSDPGTHGRGKDAPAGGAGKGRGKGH